MSSQMHTHSVPVLKQMLTALKSILAQADAHVAADFARGISARRAGVDVPSYEGKEKSFADLDALLTKTLAFLDSADASKFEGSEARDIVLRPGTPKEKKLSGRAYLTQYGLPQFFFHVTTAYDLLRHNGLAIGKLDYMGSY